jgi:hypothetical protein
MYILDIPISTNILDISVSTTMYILDIPVSTNILDISVSTY